MAGWLAWIIVSVIGAAAGIVIAAITFSWKPSDMMFALPVGFTVGIIGAMALAATVRRSQLWLAIVICYVPCVIAARLAVGYLGVTVLGPVLVIQLFVILVLVQAGPYLVRAAKGIPAIPAGRCPQCEYDLAGLRSTQCPECGAVVRIRTKQAEAAPPS